MRTARVAMFNVRLLVRDDADVDALHQALLWAVMDISAEHTGGGRVLSHEVAAPTLAERVEWPSASEVTREQREAIVVAAMGWQDEPPETICTTRTTVTASGEKVRRWVTLKETR